MYPDYITAIWEVKGETYEDMVGEARSDFSQFYPSLTDQESEDLTIEIVSATPLKIDHGAVRIWKGWAIAAWGHVEPELLSRIITDHQQYRLALVQLSQQQ